MSLKKQYFHKHKKIVHNPHPFHALLQIDKSYVVRGLSFMHAFGICLSVKSGLDEALGFSILFFAPSLPAD